MNETNSKPLVEVRDLIFDYRDRRAIHNVSFSIPAGSVTALVGPNGAGKTTLMRCLAALEEPLSGTIRIDDVDLETSPRRAHTRLGFLQDFFGVYDLLTIRQNLYHAAAAMRLPKEQIPEATRSAVAAVGLEDLIDRRASELSRGQRQRLAIARTIIHSPKLLLLDEPAAGLDPDARRELSELIKRLQKRGTTIIVSSHILTELQDYSTHMLAVRDGMVRSIIAIGPQQAQGRRLSLTASNGTGQAVDVLRDMRLVSDIKENDGAVFFDFAGDAADQTALLRKLLNRNVPVLELKTANENLEQLYFR